MTCDACGHTGAAVNHVSRWLGGRSWVHRYECQDTIACRARYETKEEANVPA